MSDQHALFESKPTLVATLLRPFSPAVETVKHYNVQKLRKDLFAGLTVSVVEVPQAMAYAVIAGVPPVYGLYTSIIQGVIGAMLSSSEHMTTGPTNTQSLLIASAVIGVMGGAKDPQRYLQLVFGLTLIKGLIQLCFAAARMGNMVRYVSRSVIVGLVSGAGFLIFFGQLPAALGIQSKVDSTLPGILSPIKQLFLFYNELNPRAVTVAASVIGVTLLVRWINRLLPGALFAVVASAGIVWVTGWGAAQLPLIERIPRGFPSFHVPQINWRDTQSLFGGALALAVIGMLESVSIAKSIAARTGEEISANQEFFAQGLKNSVTSFFQCIPGSGSFTRSALDYAAGAETRFAAVFNACFVGLIFFFAAPAAQFIPSAALAGVLIVIAIGLVDWSYIPRVIRASRTDAIVCLITFLATLLVPLQYAIFVGVFLNIGLYLRQSTQLHVTEMIPHPAGGGQFHEQELTDRTGGRQVVFLQVEGDLFFGVADDLRERLAHLTREGAGVKVVIFRLRRTHSIDSTALHVLDGFIREVHERAGTVLLCGVSPTLHTVLRHFGLIKLIGPDNVFTSGGGPFASAKAALLRARQIVGASIDIRHMDKDLDDEPWAYQI